MKTPCDLRYCTGCRSCENICPKNAIEMKSDDKGFLYPFVNEASCVHCGLCDKVCLYSEQNKNNFYQHKQTAKIYGYKNSDNKIRAMSSSGGVFYPLAKHFIEEDGSVYGCVLNQDIKPVFRRATTIEECIPMMGSKYVQSDLENCFLEVARDLKSSLNVLFTGHPCQCAALKSYLRARKISQENLLVVEFLCHGGPSPQIFEDFKELMEKKYKGEIIDFKFRDKEKPRQIPSCRGMRALLLSTVPDTELQKRKTAPDTEQQRNASSDTDLMDVFDETLNDRHFELFKRNYLSRECCYGCNYVGFEQRAGDISIADFWGCEKYYPEFFDKYGVSLILLNSDAGERYFKAIKDTGKTVEVEREKCLQASLKGAPKRPENYTEFWQYYHKHGYEKATIEFTRKFILQKKYHEFKHSVKVILLRLKTRG